MKRFSKLKSPTQTHLYSRIGGKPFVSGFSVMHYKNKSLQDLCGEAWKPVIGYKGVYEVSSLGRVKSIDRVIPYATGNHRPAKGYMQFQRMDKNGYLSVGLWAANKEKRHSVHRLVAKSFISNVDNKPVVNHKDSNRVNNVTCNLEWCTASENMRHAVKAGSKIGAKGEDSGVAKLNNSQVLEIFSSPLPRKTLAIIYGVSGGQISAIKTGWSWSHLTGMIHRSRLSA